MIRREAQRLAVEAITNLLGGLDARDKIGLRTLQRKLVAHHVVSLAEQHKLDEVDVAQVFGQIPWAVAFTEDVLERQSSSRRAVWAEGHNKLRRESV